MKPLLRMHLVCFPPACWVCGRLMEPLTRGQPGFPYLCPDCQTDLPWCTGEITEGNPPRSHNTGSPLSEVWAACHYANPVSRWIWALKYEGRDSTARLLGHVLRRASFGAAPLTQVDLVAPVPLHRRRLRQRGFNQALLLAHRWLRAWNGRRPLPALCPDLLVRQRYTRPQVEMTGSERRANVAGAFTLGAPPRRVSRPGGDPLRGLRILLVDDVMTTGSTLEACAEVLLSAGAMRVEGLVLARA